MLVQEIEGNSFLKCIMGKKKKKKKWNTPALFLEHRLKIITLDGFISEGLAMTTAILVRALKCHFVF